jgi:hypothetical protein
MQIRQVPAQFYHADGQTDVAKLTDTFRNRFAKRRKKIQLLPHSKHTDSPIQIRCLGK